MAQRALKNHPVTQLAHYLFLLPFLPALQPLMVNFRTADMAVYLAGIVLVLSLVIYGNLRPLVLIETNRLCLHLHYRHNAEYHPYTLITDYKRLSGTRISIRSRDHQPVVLRLKASDIDTLIEKLEEEHIHAQTP